MKKIYYILSGLIISIILILGLQSKAYAATATISASKSEIEKGNSVNINANINNASSWELNITATGGNLNKLDSRVGNTDSGNNESKTVTIGTFTASEAGTYTITLSGYVVDGESLSKATVSGTVQVTVKDPAPVVQEPQPEPQKPAVEETPNFTNANKTMYASKDINLRASWSTNSKATSIDKGTELAVTGTSTNKVNGYVWYRVTYNSQTLYVASSLLTSEKPQEEQVEEPEETPNEEEPAVIDENNENVELKEGLKSLEIDGVTLSPKFDPNIYEYRVILKENITELDVNAITTSEDATITIAGNDNLQEGENLIIIVVYNAKDEVQATYQITVNKNTLDLTDTDNLLQEGTQTAKRNLIIFIVILTIAIIGLIVVIVLKRKNANDDEYEDELDEEFTNAEGNVENIEEQINEEEQIEEEIRRPRREKRKGKHF